MLAASDPNAGGGPGRKSWAVFNTHGFQVPARAATGVALLHTPGAGGYDPMNAWFDPSVCAYAMTARPTLWPKSNPPNASLGKATPAITRDAADSLAMSARFAAL